MRFWRGEPGEKRLLETPRHRCKDDIKVDLKETGWEGVDWIHLALDRDKWLAVLNTAMSVQVQ
jgi:hypothetical protein